MSGESSPNLDPSEEFSDKEVHLLAELGAIIDVAEGEGDILGILDPADVEPLRHWGHTLEGAKTVEFMKIILGVDNPLGEERD